MALLSLRHHGIQVLFLSTFTSLVPSRVPLFTLAEATLKNEELLDGQTSHRQGRRREDRGGIFLCACLTICQPIVVRVSQSK